MNGTKKPSKKAKKSKKDDDDDDDDDWDNSIPSGVIIELNSHVSLTFSLKYLVNFAKSATICGKVQLMLSNDVPLLVRVASPLFFLATDIRCRFHLTSNKDIFGITWRPRLGMIRSGGLMRRYLVAPDVCYHIHLYTFLRYEREFCKRLQHGPLL